VLKFKKKKKKKKNKKESQNHLIWGPDELFP